MTYSRKMRGEALDLWFELLGTMSVEEFVAELGYPCATTMSAWIKADPRHDPDKATYRSKPVLTKLEAIRRVAEGASTVRAAREAGLSQSHVSALVSKFAEGGTAALLPGPTIRREAGMAGRKKGAGRRPAPVMQGPPDVPRELPDDPEALKAIVRELQMDNAILREVLDVLKADPGCDPADLTAAERAAVRAFRVQIKGPRAVAVIHGHDQIAPGEGVLGGGQLQLPVIAIPKGRFLPIHLSQGDDDFKERVFPAGKLLQIQAGAKAG